MSDKECPKDPLFDAALGLATLAMQSPPEVQQRFAYTLAAAQGYLERQWDRDKGGY